MKQAICIIGICLFSHAFYGQTVTAVTDRDSILIGEQFHLQLSANFEQNTAVAWFTIDTLLHFEIMERSEVDTVLQGNRLQLTQTFKLTSWDSGIWSIPAFSIARVRTKPIRINVAFSPHPFDVNQPYHDIKDLIEIKKPVANKWYWYLVFLLVLILLFLLFFPAGKKREQETFVPQEGAYRAALRKLDVLEGSIPQDSRIFYTELVHIYREYLFKRWNIRSFSKTTDDLAIQMDRLELPDDLYRQTVQTLRLSDMVKFARYQPPSEENRKALKVIRESIFTIERLPHAV